MGGNISLGSRIGLKLGSNWAQIGSNSVKFGSTSVSRLLPNTPQPLERFLHALPGQKTLPIQEWERVIRGGGLRVENTGASVEGWEAGEGGQSAR